MDRRKFFRAFPAAVLAVPSLVTARAEEKPEDSPWSETVCTRPGYNMADHGVDCPPCRTKFKFLRAPTMVVCPACGWVQDMSRNEETRAKISGIEVK